MHCDSDSLLVLSVLCMESGVALCVSLLGSAWAGHLEEDPVISASISLNALWLHILSPLPAGEPSLYLIFIEHPWLVGTMQTIAALKETKLKHQVLEPAIRPHASETEWLEALRDPGYPVVP